MGRGRPARVVLGRVVGGHGLRGEIRVRFLGDGPANLLRLPELVIGRSADEEATGRFAVVQTAPGRAGEVRMLLSGIRSREAAEELRGLLVLGDPADLEPLPPGEYYWYQLVGCEVQGLDGRRIGTVREIWETGAHDVLVVDGEGGREILLPAAEALLREVDVDRGRIVMDVVPGLLEGS